MIRRCIAADLACLTQAEQLCFPDDPWKEDNYRYELNSNPYANLYMVEENGQICGYVDLWITFETAQIANIGVVPEHRRKQIGEKLLKHAISEAQLQGCETITLEVRVSNEPAICLYEKFGFINAGRRRNYYENGEDAWLMVKPLGGTEL